MFDPTSITIARAAPLYANVGAVWQREVDDKQLLVFSRHLDGISV